jgi:hypothetical protein
MENLALAAGCNSIEFILRLTLTSIELPPFLAIGRRDKEVIIFKEFSKGDENFADIENEFYLGG